MAVTRAGISSEIGRMGLDLKKSGLRDEMESDVIIFFLVVREWERDE